MPGTRKYILGVGIVTQIKLVLWIRTWLPVRFAWYLQGNIEIYIMKLGVSTFYWCVLSAAGQMRLPCAKSLLTIEKSPRMSAALGWRKEVKYPFFLSLKGSSRIIESYFTLIHDWLNIILGSWAFYFFGRGQSENTPFSFRQVTQTRHYLNFVAYVQIFAHIQIVPPPNDRQHNTSITAYKHSERRLAFFDCSLKSSFFTECKLSTTSA